LSYFTSYAQIAQQKIERGWLKEPSMGRVIIPFWRMWRMMPKTSSSSLGARPREGSSSIQKSGRDIRTLPKMENKFGDISLDDLVKSLKRRISVIPANPGSGPGQAPESSISNT
jgi:hypothetical protein